jgi:TonB family protein
MSYALSAESSHITYTEDKKPMDLVLSPYVGRDNVIHAPIPKYPSHNWEFKEGRGVYELHIGASGAVEEVKLLKSSGDSDFDRAAKKTLRKWKLRHGPMVIELPLRFVMTPTSYSVQIAR